MRQRLAKIGIQSNLSDLPAWKADAFVIISSHIDQLQSEEHKKNRDKAKARK